MKFSISMAMHITFFYALINFGHPRIGIILHTVNAFRAFYQGLYITRIRVKSMESFLSVLYSFLHPNSFGLLQTLSEERTSSPYVTA